MASDITVPICLTGAVFLVIFCTIAFVTNGCLLMVLYKDPFKCFRKPIMVYVGTLALLDFLSGSVTGPWVINNYVECGMGEDDSPVLDKTRFAAISAEFTICTANFITLVLSVERLFAVACPFLYRRKSSVKRSVIILSFAVLYPLSVSLASFLGSRWRDTPFHAHMIITMPMVTLISVNIALVVALRRQNRQAKIFLGGSESTPSGFREGESKRKERENSLCVTTQLVVSCFVLSLLPYLSFFYVILYFPEFRGEKWLFAGTRFFLPFVFLNPAMNSLIFNFRLKHVRRSFRHVFMSDSRIRLHDIQLTPFARSMDSPWLSIVWKRGHVSGINLEFVSIRAYKCSSSTNWRIVAEINLFLMQ